MVDIAPDSTLITRGNPWFVPDDGNDDGNGWFWTVSLWAAAVIDRLGLCIKARFAGRYYSKVAIVAHPFSPSANPAAEWLRDGAAIVGSGLVGSDYDGPLVLTDLDRKGEENNRAAGGDNCGNDNCVCNDNCCNNNCVCNDQSFRLPAQEDFARAIEAVSAFATLKTGDLILLPLPVSFTPGLKGNFAVTDDAGNRLLLFKSR